MATVKSPIVKFISSDDKSFCVERDVISQSVTIKNMLEDIATDDVPIPLPNVSGQILEKIITYCNYHATPVANETTSTATGSTVGSTVGSVEPTVDGSIKHIEISPWDEEFCKIGLPILFELILAANYLDIKPLLDLTCQTIANMIKGKTTAEIRKTFNITSDLTPEEEKEIIKENEWCEDK
jgi:S-phase kinase-associated protein 1